MAEWLGVYAETVNWIVLFWCFLLTAGYLSLGVLSIKAAARTIRDEKRRTINASSLAMHPSQPIVTVVVAAYNEESSIEMSIRGLLKQTWRRLEIIVVTNGCTDNTLGVLQSAFALEVASDNFVRTSRNALGSVRSAWFSTTQPNLRVIDIGRGGKADALNCGLERANGTYMCTMDADSLLAPDAVAQAILPFIEQGSDVLAVGSVIRVLNGATIVDGIVRKPGLPRTISARIQIVEYARGFHLGRSGWAEIGALPIISGAFAAFRTSALRAIGGFRVDTVGEDMEVVLRLHDVFRPKRGRKSIVFVPRPLCWTEVPEDTATLHAQRSRWQRGLLEAVSLHKHQIMKNTGVGTSALPFLAILELFAPVFELAGIIAVILAMFLGVLNAAVGASLIVLLISLGLLLSAVGILLEQVVGGCFLASGREAVWLFFASILEQLGPRQVTAWWRLCALFGKSSGVSTWEGIEHHGASSVATVVKS